MADGVGFLRPLPLQAGHFRRIKATPSDLPLMSTGLAMYPVPPQCGQSFGFTPSPLSWRLFFATCSLIKPKNDLRYEKRTNLREEEKRPDPGATEEFFLERHAVEWIRIPAQNDFRSSTEQICDFNHIEP